RGASPAQRDAADRAEAQDGAQPIRPPRHGRRRRFLWRRHRHPGLRDGPLLGCGHRLRPAGRRGGPRPAIYQDQRHPGRRPRGPGPAHDRRADMSEADDSLRDMAANRGCKLVRSRVRTPGRGDYGKFGLKDAKTGKEVLGFGKKGLTATADEIETFLRGGAASAWKSSVGKMPARKKAPAKPAPDPEPKVEAKLVIRDIRPKDIDTLVGLITA